MDFEKKKRWIAEIDRQRNFLSSFDEGSLEQLARLRTLDEMRDFLLALVPQEPAGMLRVCAWTGKIFHNNEWVKLENYFSDVLGIQCTSGICPEKFAELTRAHGGKNE